MTSEFFFQLKRCNFIAGKHLISQTCFCKGCPSDTGSHHPITGSHSCGTQRHAQSHGAHPANPSAEVLPTSLTAGRSHHRSAWLHGHHRKCEYKNTPIARFHFPPGLKPIIAVFACIYILLNLVYLNRSVTIVIGKFSRVCWSRQAASPMTIIYYCAIISRYNQ